MATQAEINANRKKVGINPLIKTQNEKELIPFKLESNAVDKNS